MNMITQTNKYINFYVDPVFLIVEMLEALKLCLTSARVFSYVISIGILAPDNCFYPKWRICRKDVDIFSLLLLSPCPPFSMSGSLNSRNWPQCCEIYISNTYSNLSLLNLHVARVMLTLFIFHIHFVWFYVFVAIVTAQGVDC